MGTLFVDVIDRETVAAGALAASAGVVVVLVPFGKKSIEFFAADFAVLADAESVAEAVFVPETVFVPAGVGAVTTVDDSAGNGITDVDSALRVKLAFETAD
jgi:hypothetical protein